MRARSRPRSRRATVFPSRSSSRMRSLIRTLASTAMPSVSTSPAMPGSVTVASKRGQCRENEEDVQQQRAIREESSAAVVDEHEQDHERAADGERHHALLNRVASERRADRALLGQRDGRGQRPGAEDDREVARLAKIEVAGDGRASAADTLADDWRGLHLAVEDDRQLAVHVRRPSAARTAWRRGCSGRARRRVLPSGSKVEPGRRR